MPEIASNTQGILVIPKPSTGRHSHLLQLGDIVQLLYVPKKVCKATAIERTKSTLES